MCPQEPVPDAPYRSGRSCAFAHSMKPFASLYGAFAGATISTAPDESCATGTKSTSALYGAAGTRNLLVTAVVIVVIMNVYPSGAALISAFVPVIVWSPGI